MIGIDIALGIGLVTFFVMMSEKIMKTYDRLTIIESKLEHLIKHVEYTDEHYPKCKP